MIRLFRAPFSTNSERVALALAHKDPEVESIVISCAAPRWTSLDWFNEVWKVAPNAIDSELKSEEPDTALIESEGRRMRAFASRSSRRGPSPPCGRG